MEGVATVAVSCTSQLALDFDGNLRRIRNSIAQAKEKHARLRLGSELELCSYGCQNHFVEPDIFIHSLQALAEIMGYPETKDMVICTGMPIIRDERPFSCQVVFLNRKILYIRPKRYLDNFALHNQKKWFSAWDGPIRLESYHLPAELRAFTEQDVVPFGDAILRTKDASIAFGMGSRYLAASKCYADAALYGVDIVCLSCANYFETDDWKHAPLMKSENDNAEFGGALLYSNQRGCDGDTVYYNGGSCVYVNGALKAATQKFSLEEVETAVAAFSLNEMSWYRRGKQVFDDFQTSNLEHAYPRLEVNFSLAGHFEPGLRTSPAVSVIPSSHFDQIEYGLACWLWDYLRKSGQHGFLLPLSGGADSSAVACIVSSMCHMLYARFKESAFVRTQLQKVLADPHFFPQSSRDVCKRLLYTVYLAGPHSSDTTETNARKLAQEIGCTHYSMQITGVMSSIWNTFAKLSNGRLPSSSALGGSATEDLALQNAQARVRMVLAYVMSQLSLWMNSHEGRLLVLGTANADEGFVGYYTKYDCSAADINPIGSFNKITLRDILCHYQQKYKYESLKRVLSTPSTAELSQAADGTSQQDETDIGLTYEELNTMANVRKEFNCGPYTMFCKLQTAWNNVLTAEQIAEKVKRYFVCYATNRHKMVTLTPFLHMSSADLDDRRNCPRPFLLNSNWTWQFRKIDQEVERVVTVLKQSNTSQ